MYLLENFILNCILLLFPILLYLFYLTVNTRFIKEETHMLLDLALLSSVLLVLRLSIMTGISSFTLIINIPLIIAYLKERYLAVIIINSLIIFSHGCQDLYLFIFLILEYLTIFILYKKVNRKYFVLSYLINKFVFSFVYLFIFSNELYYFLNTILQFVILSILTYFFCYLFNKSHKIISMHLSLEEFEKDKTVRESLFKITHEIKNPIAVCKSYLDMYDHNNQEHSNYIPIIKEEIDKILYLLQDFSAMNKIKIEANIMDINMLLEMIVDHFEPILKNKIKFIYEIRQDEIYMLGDFNRLNQVFTNIVKNSIEAMDKKDGIIKIYTEKTDKKINIYFEDNGMGILDVDKIKEPFYTTKKNGTGLGVSLSCEIISAHKGTICYKSKVGIGTRVVITLPILNEFN